MHRKKTELKVKIPPENLSVQELGVMLFAVILLYSGMSMFEHPQVQQVVPVYNHYFIGDQVETATGHYTI